MPAEKVFISYSHDSPEHSERVLALANALFAGGLHVDIDQFETFPSQGWPQWCAERLRPENADFVLMICTPTYRDRIEKRVVIDEGRGVFWEGALIHQYIYEEKGNTRFIPVLLDDSPEDSVPFPLRPYSRYRVKRFEVSDPGFDALYCMLTGQTATPRPPLGQVKHRPARAPPENEPGPPPPVDVSRIYNYAPKDLIGREAQTADIEDSWAKAARGEPHPFVLTFIALGGRGKTSLIAKWANDLAARGWPGCEAAFAWSFHSQGSNDQVGASSDLFLAEAINFFGAETIEAESAYDKGKRLAKIVQQKRALLILDGLEPLQYPPNSPLDGQLKDDGILSLLRGLAQRNAGLCIVTTRYEIANLKGYSATAPQRELAPLSEDAGAKLLAGLGVKGTEKERKALSVDVKGHALTLEIVGGYLRDAHDGDIRKVGLVKFEEADAHALNGHAFRAMAAYARWLESEGQKGRRALAVLRLTGLFDRPANAGCLAALWRKPFIKGLADPFANASEADRNVTLTRLEDAKLLTVARDASGALLSIEAHPLLREYFADELRRTRGSAWKAGHRRLYEHLTATTVDKEAPTLDDLQPLYQAVAHGCLAGLHEEVCDEVFIPRIQRGTDSGGFYSTHKLGAFGAEIGALACFFDPPWRGVSSHLKPQRRAWLMNQAAFGLRALGRLAEALESMRLGYRMNVEHEDWNNAAIAVSNLSELELTLGELGSAAHDGETAVTHSDRSGPTLFQSGTRTTYADVLNQAGRGVEALALFVEAETMQAELQPGFPRLYSIPGFRYCDMQLVDAERAAFSRPFRKTAVADGQMPAGYSELSSPEILVAACGVTTERARQTLLWTQDDRNTPLLTIGLDHLTLARAAIYAAILRDERPPGDHVDRAVDFVRRAASQDHLPSALLTRALHRAVTDNFDGAREDLDEAYEIAERGPMRLHLADIYLHRARLFGLFRGRPGTYPWTSARADLDEARKLIETCGYGRRLGELEDAEAAMRALGG